MKWLVLVGVMLIAASSCHSRSFQWTRLIRLLLPLGLFPTPIRYICTVLQVRMICFDVSLSGLKGKPP